MATFVYSPAIRVHVETEDHGILDISDDITQWELVRRTNAPSSFTFVLQNTQRKYDRAFRPSDRISVELKRITWVRVFTGSLNNVPLFSAWPRALTLSATCSLKKLQFWPWDPTTNESSNMIIRFMNRIRGDAGSVAKGDQGLSGLIAESLVRVTGWEEKAIHIGAVPNAWFKWAQRTEQAVDAASNMAAILGPSSIGGGTSGNLTLRPGAFGSQHLDQDQLDIAATIFAAVVSEPSLTTTALQDRAATITLMVALDESSLTNIAGGDRDSTGVFQQRDSYGTPGQRQQVEWATMAFLKGCPATGADGSNRGVHISGLLDYPWKTGDNLGLIAQGVQRSYDHSGLNYTAYRPTAEDLVRAFRSAPGTGAQASPVDPTGLHETGRSSYRGTGNMVAKVAHDLITVLNTPPNIKYAWPYSLRSDPRSDHPKYLDCSGLVLWVLYHTTSNVWSAGDAASQYAACTIKDIPMDIAKDIRGCLLFGVGESNGPFGGTPHHVGIALGDGQGSHVAAHTNDTTIDKQVDISSVIDSGLYSGALAPHIDYTNSAITEKARAYLQRRLGKPCTIAPRMADIGDPSVTGTDPGTIQNDPFAALVSAITFAPTINGDIFGGSRQLINNQPFLPWLANLTNSTMRAFCSAPNGDFMAWFPDYFNVWETAAIMDIKLIELKDFTVEWSDQQMVTHEFVLGSIAPTLDTATGAIADGGADTYGGVYAMLGTEGIATMDFPQIFTTIYGKAASSAFVSDYLKRFGARPNVEAMPNIMHGAQEFYMALWLFMKHWAEQFNATVPMTFMPELWPGMILRIQEYGFQAYVSEVTHRGSYGPNGQFTTDAKIVAPAPIDKDSRGSLFGMLDVFGDQTKVNK